MKATGIVRRIDDLGRVVVPKEIRRTLRIREGDPLEIFTDKEGEIILKKYSPIGELSSFAQIYTDSLAQATGKTACVCDRDQIIAAAGGAKRELIGKDIHKELEQTIDERENLVASENDKKYVEVTDQETSFKSQVVATIICEGDAIGAVILLDKDHNAQFGNEDLKIVSVAADFLGRKMEN